MSKIKPHQLVVHLNMDISEDFSTYHKQLSKDVELLANVHGHVWIAANKDYDNAVGIGEYDLDEIKHLINFLKP